MAILPCLPVGTQASQVSGAASVTCVGDAHQVHVAGSYYEPIPGEYDHILLQRLSIGVCEPDEFLTDATLPWAPVADYGRETFAATVTVVPPGPTRVYRYVPWLVRPDGSRVAMRHYCDADWRSYALTDCGTAPFLRGRVELDWSCPGTLCFRVAACSEDCWDESYWEPITIEQLTALSGLTVGEVLGRVVDVYGGRTYCGMPGDPGYVLARMELVEGDACGPVPVHATSWGSFKAMYR